MKFYKLFEDDLPDGTNHFCSAIERRYGAVESIDECDYVMYNKPTNTKSISEFRNLKNLGKPAIILWDTDNDRPFVNEDIELILFRTSLRKSRKLKNEWTLPSHLNYSWTERDSEFDWSFSEYYSDDMPSVGFCGQAHRRCRSRKNLIEFFKRDEGAVVFNLIQRGRFYKSYRFDEIQYRNLRQEFIDNLKTNIFSLCAKGSGNWSIRFYESMKLGRIPALLDTDMELPFSDFINWDDVIVFDRDAVSLRNKMIEWHSMGSGFIFEKQKQCYDIWEKYLSLDGFAKNFIRYL